jgi:hypothetical protein
MDMDRETETEREERYLINRDRKERPSERKRQKATNTTII